MEIPESYDKRTEHQRAVVIKVMYWSLIVIAVLGGLKYVLPLVWPFILAYLVAWALDKPIGKISKKTHMPRGIVSVVTILLFVVAAIGIITLIVSSMFSWANEQLTALPSLFENTILPSLENFFTNFEEVIKSVAPIVEGTVSDNAHEIAELINKGIVGISGTLISALGGILTSVPKSFMKILVSIIACIFISVDFKRIHEFTTSLLPEKCRLTLGEGGRFFGRVVPKCLLSYVFILCITFVELWLGFMILGIENGTAIAFIVAILDILPVLGTGTVLIPWALISFLTGNITRGIGLAVIYIAITAIRNMIEPKIVGSQIQLHPVLTFAGMFIGLQLFGLIGLFGIPLILAFLRQLSVDGILNIPVLDYKKPKKEKENIEE